MRAHLVEDQGALACDFGLAVDVVGDGAGIVEDVDIAGWLCGSTFAMWTWVRGLAEVPWAWLLAELAFCGRRWWCSGDWRSALCCGRWFPCGAGCWQWRLSGARRSELAWGFSLGRVDGLRISSWWTRWCGGSK